jgi:hypothetical protein
MPFILPLSKAIANLPNTDSFLNKFTYTSGLDANGVGDVIWKAIKECNEKIFILEGDFTLYDAS